MWLAALSEKPDHWMAFLGEGSYVSCYDDSVATLSSLEDMNSGTGAARSARPKVLVLECGAPLLRAELVRHA